MVLFCSVELSCFPNVSHRHHLFILSDFARSNCLSYFSFYHFCLMNLIIRVTKYNWGILGAFVIALLVLNGWVMKREEKFTECFKRCYACIKQNMAHFYMTSVSFANILISRIYELGVYIRIHKAYACAKNRARKNGLKIFCEIFFSTPITPGSECTNLKIRILLLKILPIRGMIFVCIFTSVPNIGFLVLSIILLHE